MNRKEQSIIKRPVGLPQKLVYQPTFLDRFFDILEQRSSSIELPDFLIPQIDVYESPTAVTLEIELPGTGLNDVAYRIQGDIIHIKGEKRKIHRQQQGSSTRLERRYGIFERILRLPAEVEDQPREIAYHDGILRLTLPKRHNLENAT